MVPVTHRPIPIAMPPAVTPLRGHPDLAGLLSQAGAAKTEEQFQGWREARWDPVICQKDWCLMEIFPKRVWATARTTLYLFLFVAQSMNRFSGKALWIETMSFITLVLPVVLETELLQIEPWQRQVLPVPITGLSAGTAGPLPSLPGRI